MLDNISGIITKIVDKLPIIEAWRARSSAHLAHDQKKFSELDGLLSEVTLKNILDEVFHHRIERSALRPIDEYIEWMKLSGNQFLIKRIRKSQAPFNAQLRDLRNFLSANLFTVNEDRGYLYFRPDQNSSRGPTTAEDRKLFDDHVVELEQKMSSCEETYRTFRETILSQLYV